LLRFDTKRRPARNYFSRREQWRLLLIIMSLGVVILLMRALRQPETVARVAQVFSGEAAPAANGKQATADPVLLERPSDSFQLSAPEPPKSGESPAQSADPEVPDLQRILSLSEWTPERFAQFSDNEPLTDSERGELVQLLWRVQTFDAASIEAWASDGPAFRQLSDNPAAHRGEIVRFTARAVKFERHDLTSEQAVRFEMPAYYTCRVEIADGGGNAVVITRQLPRSWTQIQPLAEPVSVSGMFMKQLPAGGDDDAQDNPENLFVAKRVEWHPTTSREPAISLGMSILGSLGMDVGLLDQVRSHGPLDTGIAADRPRFNDEREAFYQMLVAAGKIGANQLIRIAKGNLGTIRAQWERELRETRDLKRQALAHEVIKRAEAGLYSFALLFFDGKRQIGQPAVFDGIARRVVRVDSSVRADNGSPSDVARRFGIDHYYEMQVFTDDSQNYPLVCCVREVPAGLSMGDDLHVPVRVAGFFFKDWRYTTRGTRDLETGELLPGEGKQQHAPLLIGRAPVLLKIEDERGMARLVGGGLFLLALGGIWAAAWWLSRGDRRYAERRRESAHSLPPGQSLNDLNVPVADVPLKDEG
jgi:hypothetical protein